MKIGLTGSIGTGKSTVSNIFKKENIKVIDADNISKEVMKSDECIIKIVKAFGTEIIDLQGCIDRRKLRDIVFKNKNKLRLLEEITHPLIREKINLEYEKLKKEKIIVFDIPLLFELGYDKDMDKIIVVSSNESNQLKRIIKRDNTTPEKAKLIINMQMSQKEKRVKADYVIDNDASLDELETKVIKVLKQLQNIVNK